MKNLYFLLIGLMCLLLVNCKNDKTTLANTPTVTPSVKSTADGFYKHFKGTVDTFAVTMDLVQIKNQSTDFDLLSFRGHYYYDKYQEPIAIYGELDSMSNIVLHESNLQQKDIVFEGKRHCISNSAIGLLAEFFHNFNESRKS